MESASTANTDDTPSVRMSLTLSQQQRDWLMLVSHLHLEQSKAESACVLLRLVYRVFPYDAEVQRCLALAELLAGSPEAAARASTRALKRTEGRLRVPVGLVFAKALWNQGKCDAARDFLTNLLSGDHK